MTYTATLYFFGDYRPLTLEDTAPARLKIRLAHATQNADIREWAKHAATEAIRGMTAGYSSTSIDHGKKGFCMRAAPHDPWLDRITATLPAYPGIDYNA